MGNHAYIKLVSASKEASISLQGVKELLDKYVEISKKTGEQHNWDYENFSFPYKMEMPPNDAGVKLKLVPKQDRYEGFLAEIGHEELEDESGNKSMQHMIQVSLLPNSTNGDKDRAIDYCKFMAKQLAGELHLFNGRIMYFYPRK